MMRQQGKQIVLVADRGAQCDGGDTPPAGGVKSGRGNAKAGVKQGSQAGKRDIRNVKPDGNDDDHEDDISQMVTVNSLCCQQAVRLRSHEDALRRCALRHESVRQSLLRQLVMQKP
jgi:hypothetical protein